jgi:hypothetical protein
MADPSGLLRAALKPWIKTDAAVIAAFAAQTVKVFALLPPPNSAKPYVFLAGFSLDPILAQCFHGGEILYQVDVWSLTDPPGFAEAERIAPAVADCLNRLADPDSPAFAIVGWAVKASPPPTIDYLTDPSDGKTTHAIIRGRLTLAPL